MNNTEAAQNVLTTVIAAALAEASGHPNQIAREDEAHARRITSAVDHLIQVHLSGRAGEEYA